MSHLAALSQRYGRGVIDGVIAAIGTGSASIPLIASLMSKWFDKHRGLAISLALSGNCIGQFILVPLFSQVVLRFGWRASYAVIGLLILAVNTIIVLMVVKGKPQDLGLMPYGHKTEVDPKPSTKKLHQIQQPPQRTSI